jgi:hypothetical protein
MTWWWYRCTYWTLVLTLILWSFRTRLSQLISKMCHLVHFPRLPNHAKSFSNVWSFPMQLSHLRLLRSGKLSADLWCLAWVSMIQQQYLTRRRNRMAWKSCWRWSRRAATHVPLFVLDSKMWPFKASKDSKAGVSWCSGSLCFFSRDAWESKRTV